MKTSKRLIIFEGPDGAGKTTLARKLADDLGALYTHLGPFPRVKRGLGRLYVEAMLPAVLGLSDVVLDRSWLSEPIYGAAYRDGADRLGNARTRVLERLALRCETTVIRCLPPYEVVAENFKARKQEEYLPGLVELRKVYDGYANLDPALPMTTLDPFNRAEVKILLDYGLSFPSEPHPLSWATAGNLNSNALLVGEGFGDQADGDPLYSWPFGSLEDVGCSLWLADQLTRTGETEYNFCWINADALRASMTALLDKPLIVALGAVANDKLHDLGVKHHKTVPHPQYWKRFCGNQEYPLIKVVKEFFNED